MLRLSRPRLRIVGSIAPLPDGTRERIGISFRQTTSKPGGMTMRATTRLMLGVGSIIAAISGADAAAITGTVTGPDGKPFRGAFVQARNLKTKITVSVLSDNAGKYRVENLPAGDYRLQMRAIGFKADPKSGIKLTADQALAQDFALQKGS